MRVHCWVAASHTVLLTLKINSSHSIRCKHTFLLLGTISELGPTPAVAQYFIRSVGTKTEIKLPLYSPGLEEFSGDSPPSSLLPDNFVFGGDLGKRIYEKVMAFDPKSFFASCHDTFCKHENCPVLIQDVDYQGFKELVRPQWVCFHEDPCRLWNGPLLVGWKVRHAKDMVSVDTQALAQARATAVMQTVVPAITASDQVSVVLEPDKGEYLGVAAAAHPDRPGHGGRT